MATSLADALTNTGTMPASSLGGGAPKDTAAPPTPKDALPVNDQTSADLYKKVADDENKRPVLPTVANGMLKEAPKPDAENDPMKGYVSAIGVLGAIGSIFTRVPMIKSMNAAAGVVTAMNNKDEADFKKKYEVWKTENDNAMQLFDYQQKLYKN